MFHIQTFTAKADFPEDRIRLDAVDPDGNSQQIHVTRRLADRFVPLLLDRVVATAAPGKARELDLAMRQERLRNERNENPIAEVETRQDAQRWLCLTMHLGGDGDELTWTLTDEAGNEAFWDGEDDPNIRVLRVRPSSAEFWDSPGKIVTSVKMAAAVLTGSKPKLGENRKVAL